MVGAGGLGREVALLIGDIDGMSFKHFLDDNVEAGTMLKGWGPVAGQIGNASNDPHVIAIGSTGTRRAVAGRLGSPAAPVLVHPKAWVGLYVDFSTVRQELR